MELDIASKSVKESRQNNGANTSCFHNSNRHTLHSIPYKMNTRIFKKNRQKNYQEEKVLAKARALQFYWDT